MVIHHQKGHNEPHLPGLPHHIAPQAFPPKARRDDRHRDYADEHFDESDPDGLAGKVDHLLSTEVNLFPEEIERFRKLLQENLANPKVESVLGKLDQTYPEESPPL